MINQETRSGDKDMHDENQGQSTGISQVQEQEQGVTDLDSKGGEEDGSSSHELKGGNDGTTLQS